MFEVLFNFVGNLEGLRQAFGKAAEMERQAASQQDGNFRKMQSAQERAAQSLAALDKVKLANQTRINELRQKEINIENNIAQIREKVSRYAQQRGVDSTGAPVGLNPNTLKQLDVQRQQHAAVQNEIRAIESRNRLIDESSRKVITYRDNVAAAQRAYTANQQAQARRSAEGAAYLGINTPTPDRNGFYNAAQLGQLEKAQTEQTTATRASVEQQRRDIARLRTEHADAINQQIADLRRLDDSIYQNMLAHKRASEVSAEAARQETAARSQLAQAESKIGASVFTAQLAQVQQRRDAALVARREAKTQLDEITKQLNEAESNFKAKVEPMQAKGTPAESIAADSEVKYLQQQVTLLREKRQAAVASVNAANESVKAVDAESKAVRKNAGEFKQTSADRRSAFVQEQMAAGAVNKTDQANLNQLRAKVSTLNSATQARAREESAAARVLDQDRRNSVVQQRNLQDMRRRFTAEQQVAQAQLQQSVQARQKWVGAGFTLMASNIAPLQALAGPMISYGFGGGPMAAMAALGTAVGLVVKGVQGVISGIRTAWSEAYKFNQELHASALATAGIIATTTDLVDAQGRLIMGSEKFTASQRIAMQMQQDLIGMIIRTNITYQEAQQAIQTGLGFLLARNVAPRQAQEIIITLTALAKNLGFEGARAAQQVRSAFTGTRSVLLNMLQSLGLTRKELSTLSGDEFTAKMQNRLQFLRETVLQSSTLLKTQFENVGDVIKYILGMAFEDAQRRAGRSLNAIVSYFFDSSNKLTAEGERVKNAFGELFSSISGVLEKLAQPNVLSALVGTLTNVLSIVKQIGTGMLSWLGFGDKFEKQMSNIESVTAAFSRTQQARHIAQGLKKSYPELAQGVNDNEIYNLTNAIIRRSSNLKNITDVDIWNASKKALQEYQAEIKTSGESFSQRMSLSEEAPIVKRNAGAVVAELQKINAERQKLADKPAESIAPRPSIILNEFQARDVNNVKKVYQQLINAEVETPQMRQKGKEVNEFLTKYEALSKLEKDSTAGQELKAKVIKAQNEYLELTKNKEGQIRIDVLGTNTAMEARQKVYDLLQRYAREEDQRATRKLAVTAEIQRLSYVEKQIAATNQLNRAILGTADAEKLEELVIRQQAQERIDSARLAYQEAIAETQRASARARLMQTPDDKQQAQVDFAKAIRTQEERRLDVIKAIIDQYQQQNKTMSDGGRFIEELSEKVRTQRDLLQQRNLEAMGITGAVLKDIQFQTTLSRENEELQRTINKIEQFQSKLQSAANVAQQQFSVLNGKPSSGTEDVRVYLNDLLSSAQQLRATVNANPDAIKVNPKSVDNIRQLDKLITDIKNTLSSPTGTTGTISVLDPTKVAVLQTQFGQMLGTFNQIKAEHSQISALSSQLYTYEVRNQQAQAKINLLKAEQSYWNGMVSKGQLNEYSAALMTYGINQQIAAKLQEQVGIQQDLLAKNKEQQVAVQSQMIADAQNGVLANTAKDHLRTLDGLKIREDELKLAVDELQDAWRSVLSPIDQLVVRLKEVMKITAEASPKKQFLGGVLDTIAQVVNLGNKITGGSNSMAGYSAILEKYFPSSSKSQSSDPVATAARNMSDNFNTKITASTGVLNSAGNVLKDAGGILRSGANAFLNLVRELKGESNKGDFTSEESGTIPSVAESGEHPSAPPAKTMSGIQKTGLAVAAMGIAAVGDILAAEDKVKAAVNQAIDIASSLLIQFGGFVGAIVAAVLQAVKVVFNAIRDAFQKQAKEMAKQIKEDMGEINNQLQYQGASLSAGLQMYQEQMNRLAVLRTKKGGNKLADEIYPQLRDAIASLQKEIRDVIEQFDLGLANLRLGAGFKDFTSAVQEALKQVNQYLGAGGSLSQAQEYLSLTMKDLHDNLKNQVTSAQEDALQGAIELLSLEKQREDLIKSNEQRLRDIRSQGLADRELTNAEQRARAMYQENSAFEEQLKSIDQQITSAKALLDVNQQLIQGAANLNDEEALRAGLIALQVQARQTEVETLLQQKQIMESIVQGSNGLWQMSPDLFKKLWNAGAFASVNNYSGGFSMENVTLIVQNGQQQSGSSITLTASQSQQLGALVQSIVTGKSSIGG